jgi:methionine sulfoxide reductase catalytic subunit
MTPRLRSSEITPEAVYRSRRSFMVGLGALALVACGAPAAPPSGQPAISGMGVSATAAPPPLEETPGPTKDTKDELGDVLTSHKWVTNYNNFYEFSTDKEDVAQLARAFRTTPWTLTVGGLVNKPATFGVDELITRFGQEERIYRLRCVEGWSMVIPW